MYLLIFPFVFTGLVAKIKNTKLRHELLVRRELPRNNATTELDCLVEIFRNRLDSIEDLGLLNEFNQQTTKTGFSI